MEQNETKPKKDTVIYVTVDTENINRSNVEEKVVFSDDRDDPPQKPGKPQDYVSTINPGKKVYWKGVAKDAKDKIEIIDVESKDSKGKWKLLDSVGPERDNSGVRVGKIKGKLIKDPELYSVKFRINEDPGREFLVDPKLKMEI